MICCAYARWHVCTQRASGLVQAGQWYCRVGTRGTSAGLGSVARLAEVGVWVLEKCASFTMAKCALLLESLALVHAVFFKRHQCLGKLSVLSLGEAGEWMFRDFKYRLYGTFEALFLIKKAYLMSAMITPECVVLATVVLRVPFLVTFTMAKCSLVLVFLASVCDMWCKRHLFLGELVNRVLGVAGEWVSRVFKDQVYGAFKVFTLIWRVCL